MYSLVAFLLYKNGVIHEDDVMDAKSLPLVKMPNREGYVVPEWKHGMPMPISASTKAKPLVTCNRDSPFSLQVEGSSLRGHSKHMIREHTG